MLGRGFSSFLVFLFFQTVLLNDAYSRGIDPPAKGSKVDASCSETLVETQVLEPVQVPKPVDPFLSQVVEALLKAFPPNSGVDAEKIHSLMAVPPRLELGQLAFPCFTLAKAFRTAPPKIAESLKATISQNLPPTVARVEAVGAYLNFHVNFDAYGAWLIDQARTGAFFVNRFDSEKGREKINIEFSQPNTHKALHVGHLRNMVYGEAVSRLLESAGHEVIRSTYPGDLGAHIAKVLWFIQSQKGSALPSKDHATWLGRMYAEADKYVQSHAETPEGTRIKGEIDALLAQIQGRQEPVYSLYKTTREWSLDEMKRIYSWLGIRFDQWFFESECDEPSQKLVLDKLAEGFFAKSDGAVGIDLTPHGLPFAMVLTSSGNGLYLTKDLELLRLKFQDAGTTRSLVVVDDRQRLHFRQVFKISELMGFEQAKKSIHLAYATVNSADGSPFSSRTMNGMGLDDIRKAAEDGVAPELKRRFGATVSPEQMETLIRQFALGTLKFGLLRVDAETSIRFDLADWLKADGDTAFSVLSLYLQLKQGAKGEVSSDGFQAKTASEKALVQHLGRFPFVKLDAAQKAKPSLITAYLFDLKKLVLAAQAEGTSAQLEVAAATVTKQALYLLGVEIL